MFFIIGLGNPGLKFDTTRHNVGFEVVERLAYNHNIKIDRKKHKAYVGQGIIGGHKVILVKPQTYMNLSGESVRDILDFYKEDESSIIVVYDDTSLDIGDIRIRLKGSAGGHNGIKNIIQHLGTQTFTRVKVGVGAKPPGWDLADYVLSRFDQKEIPIIVDAIAESAKAIEMIINEGPTKAMNSFNGKREEEE